MREKIVPIEVTPEMMKMLEICKKNKSINPELYTKYDVKRGLRDINGKGVLAGLTEIGEIHAYDTLSDGSCHLHRLRYFLILYRRMNVKSHISNLIIFYINAKLLLKKRADTFCRFEFHVK